MIVSMWMTRDVITGRPEDSIVDAARSMASRHVRRWPVVQARSGQTHLVGIVSDSDIIRACGPDLNPFAAEIDDAIPISKTLGEIMRRNVITVSPDAPIEEAAEILRNRKIGSLPVMRDDTLVGLITKSDIFRAFVSIFSTREGGARITFDISSGEDVFALMGESARRHGMRVASMFTSRQEDRPVCVVRVTGANVDAFLEALWGSGHRVLNVLRLGPGREE